MSEEISYKYKFSDEYNPTYVNGAHGGVGPQGEIILNFFLERQSLPQKQTFSVLDGMLGDEIAEKAKPADFRSSFIRYIETGVVMNVKTARDVREFLDQQISFLEQLAEGAKTHGTSKG